MGIRILLAGMVLGWSDPVRAEPDAATVEEARRLFEDAVAAIGREAYREALDLFQRSATLVPRPVTTFNIGMCQRALADLPAAYATLVQYLAEAADEPVERQAEASRVVLELDAVLATVTVRVDTPGVEIRVDGRAVGTSPLYEPLRLVAGSHVFEARADDGIEARVERVIGAGEALTVELRPSSGGDFAGAEEEGPGIETQWWFWTILGAAVAVGAAIAAGVALGAEEEPSAATLTWWGP